MVSFNIIFNFHWARIVKKAWSEVLGSFSGLNDVIF